MNTEYFDKARYKRDFTPVAIAIIVGVLILGGAGYFGARNFPRPVAPSVQTPAPAPVSDTSNIANWKTYRNEKYGFEFRYPAYLNIVKREWLANSVVALSPFTEGEFKTHHESIPTFAIRIRPQEASILVDNLYKELLDQALDTPKLTRIERDGKIGTLLVYMDAFSGDIVNKIIFPVNSQSLEIVYDTGYLQKVNGKEITGTVAETIFSTFKFTDQNSSYTSTWKTYRNEKYGFEFRYPDNSGTILLRDCSDETYGMTKELREIYKIPPCWTNTGDFPIPYLRIETLSNTFKFSEMRDETNYTNCEDQSGLLLCKFNYGDDDLPSFSVYEFYNLVKGYKVITSSSRQAVVENSIVLTFKFTK